MYKRRGSIGVVAARLAARQLLDSLGGKTEVVRKAPHADMFSPAREMDASERAILDRELDEFYSEFVDIVAAGRGRDAKGIEPLARGRVWSGTAAKERGLVDVLGGMDTAIEQVRERVGRGGGKLPARLLIPRRSDVPPAEPRAAAAAMVSQTLEAIAPGASMALELATTGERFLYLAPGIPTIR